MTATTRYRRMLALVSALSIAFIVTTSGAARAQTTRSRLDDARKSASRFRSEAERIASAFEKAWSARARTEGQVGRTRGDIARGRADLATLQEKLKDRVRTAYKMGGVGFFQFLLEARSFREFNLKFVALQRQTLNDEGLILRLRHKRAELESKQKQLEAESRVLQDRVEDYRSEGRRLTITLQQANSLVARLKNQLTREQIANLFRIGRGAPGRVISLTSCPVDPPHVVTNSFGAPRGGGTRRHQGNDVMAARGTPVRAVNGGTITRTPSGGLGGTALYLFDGSTEFYYAHLDSRSVTAGQNVGAGQLIGANGSTGNARGGPPHVHFEIRPGGGGAIDPYPSLSTVC